MKIAIRIGILVVVLLIMVAPVVACKEAVAPRKMTLADAPTVLDMSSELPASFEHLDAASEGLSNKDLELGPDFSEVELFQSEEPLQRVFAYLAIIESRVQRAGIDALMRDEEQAKSMVIEYLRARAAEEGIEQANVTVEVTYPNIGDSAVLVLGTMNVYGTNIGYDILMFMSNKVYVYVVSLYLPGESQSLIPLAKGVEQRIGMFSQ